MKFTVGLFAICTIAGSLAAQQPRFEAASVKHTDQCGVGKSIDPSMIRLEGFPLRLVLAQAYSVKMDQIVGPSWLDEDCFSIVAKMPEGAARDQVPAMLQALMVERFHLTFHKESRTSPGYALMVDKNGPKFKESDPNSPTAGQVRFASGPGAGGIKGPITMALLVRNISNALHSPVEDLTGLKGRYDIDVSWVPDRTMEDASSSDGANIFTALRESLGLRLERRKEKVEVLVIDHIERVPTEN
jgi:uncharacterized protein (TIGR03435 family)